MSERYFLKIVNVENLAFLKNIYFVLPMLIMLLGLNEKVNAGNLTNPIISIHLNDTIPQINTSEDHLFESDEVDTKPEFKGGSPAWAKFLSTTLKYPPTARKKNITGRVIIDLIVEKDGSLSNLIVSQSADDLLSRETIRVLNASPNWVPGKKDGKPVRVKYQLPITFKLGPDYHITRP